MKSHRRRTLRALCAVLLFGFAAFPACGSGDGDTATGQGDEETGDADTATGQGDEESGDTTSRARPGATYVGSFESEPYLAGEVSFVVAESGEEITELSVDLDTVGLDSDEVACRRFDGGGEMTLSDDPGVPIIDDTFETRSTSMDWEGTFESELMVVGTVQISIPAGASDPPCELGPFPWIAEPK